MSTNDSEDVLPAIYQYCVDVYNLMSKRAVRVPMDDGDEHLVYEGYLTKLITNPPLNLSVPYYTSITRELKRMGCIAQVKRGGGSSPSIWEVLKKPTPERFRQGSVRVKRGHAAQILEMHAQQIRALTNRVNDLELRVNQS